MAKRTLMIAPTPFFADRGCHVRVLSSYRRLESEGYSVRIVTYPLGRDVDTVNTIRVPRLAGYRKLSPGFSVYRPVLDLLVFLYAAAELLRRPYDLLYCHLHEGILVGKLLSRLFGMPVVGDLQGLLVRELEAHKGPSRLLRHLARPVELWIYAHVSRLIVSSEALRNSLKEVAPASNHITVIPDYVNPGAIGMHLPPAQLDLPPDKAIAGYLGGLQPYKGVADLLRAIPLVSTDVHFLLMGYPEEEAKKLAGDHGILGRITFTGKVPYERSASYLKRVDLAVSPKTLESGETNAKLYTYAAVGVPTVCYDLPQNRAILGEAAIYVPPRDPAALALAINTFFAKRTYGQWGAKHSGTSQT